MYQSNTIRQCLWLIATIRQNGRLTLKALQEKWTADKMGDTLYRSSFNRYRDKIFELFGLVMECDEKYQYYFQNPGELTDHSIESSLAVIFCTCRDCYGYANNMSQFERDFHCQEGLLSNAFRNNPYMRLHIDKWAQQGVKQRVLRLMEVYKEAVENRLIT